MLCRKLKHCLLINYRKNVPESPVAAQCNHTIDWSKATVVDREPDRIIVDQGGYIHPQGRCTIHESRVQEGSLFAGIGLWLVFTP